MLDEYLLNRFDGNASVVESWKQEMQWLKEKDDDSDPCKVRLVFYCGRGRNGKTTLTHIVREGILQPDESVVHSSSLPTLGFDTETIPLLHIFFESSFTVHDYAKLIGDAFFVRREGKRKMILVNVQFEPSLAAIHEACWNHNLEQEEYGISIYSLATIGECDPKIGKRVIDYCHKWDVFAPYQVE